MPSSNPINRDVPRPPSAGRRNNSPRSPRIGVDSAVRSPMPMLSPIPCPFRGYASFDFSSFRWLAVGPRNTPERIANQRNRSLRPIAHAVAWPESTEPFIDRPCAHDRQILRAPMTVGQRITPCDSANLHPLPIERTAGSRIDGIECQQTLNDAAFEYARCRSNVAISATICARGRMKKCFFDSGKRSKAVGTGNGSNASPDFADSDPLFKAFASRIGCGFGVCPEFRPWRGRRHEPKFGRPRDITGLRQDLWRGEYAIPSRRSGRQRTATRVVMCRPTAGGPFTKKSGDVFDSKLMASGVRE